MEVIGVKIKRKRIAIKTGGEQRRGERERERERRGATARRETADERCKRGERERERAEDGAGEA